MRLEGKTALVSGGTSGIGLATAKLFIREGARVAIIGRNAERLELAKQELGSNADVLGILADVSSLEEMQTATDQIQKTFGGLDIYFANAGIALPTPLGTTTEAVYQTIMDVNVKGVFFSMQTLSPILREGGSVILNTSFINQTGFAGLAVLAASKAAVRSFARTWSRELLERKIRVNAVSPGIIDTPLQEKFGGTAEEIRNRKLEMAKLVPVKRLGAADDIAQAALFLASDESKYMVGAELVVDGGISQL